jgi:hypothetical protein
LTWNVTDLQGKSLLRDSVKVEIPARESRKIKTLDIRGSLGAFAKDEILTWLALSVDGAVVSENLVLLALPKELKLADPQFTTQVNETRNGFLVTLKARCPALWTWLDFEATDAKYSDNFVHVSGEAPVKILVRPARPISKDALTKTLRVRSLFDTYSES